MGGVSVKIDFILEGSLMLASSLLRIDCWLFGGLDGASSDGQGTICSVDMGAGLMTCHLRNEKALASLER